MPEVAEEAVELASNVVKKVTCQENVRKEAEEVQESASNVVTQTTWLENALLQMMSI